VDLNTITIRSKPFSDKEDLQPVCYRCSATNPLVNAKGNYCTNCKHPFIYSAYTWEMLPLVEFRPAEDISDLEAERLIDRDPPLGGLRAYQPNVNTLKLEEPGQDTFDSDLFGRVLDQYEVCSFKTNHLQMFSV
jgi:intraflagellar transport protein 122